MKYLKVLLGVLCFPLLVSAQPVLEGGVLIGIANYKGDLARTDGFQMAENNLAFGLNVRHYLDSTKAVRANLIYGKLSANDLEHAAFPERGYSFETSLVELTVVGEWEPFGKRRLQSDENSSKLVSPYLFLGLGAVYMKPEANFGADAGENNIKDINADYANVQLVIPVGVGLKVGINDTWGAGLEAGLRNPFTDYLDGISESGNPNKGDWYFFGGASLSYRLK